LRSINPLTVVIFPSVERLREVRGTWGARALFGTVVLHEDTPHHLTLHTGPAVSIAAPDLEANPGILAHELLHWFQQDSLELSDLPYILVEGFARLTSERLLGTRTYEPVAAAFARSGTLSDVPLSLIYDVGASVAGFLWERLGGLLYDYLGWGSGGCRGLSRHCESWDFVVDEFKEQWLERLATVELSDADWVHYRAASQRLGTVYAMLEPVLGAAAKARFEAIWSDSASLVDLIEFWRIVEVTPPEPTEERWEDLAKREQTFVHIGVRNACYAAPPPVYPIEFQGQDQPQPDALQPFVDDLVALRLDGDWPTYYGLFVQLVRDLIAGGAVYEEAIPWWPAAGKSP